MIKDLDKKSLEKVESLLKTVKKASGKLKEYLNPIGFNYGFNEGEYAGQSVEHLHFHILPSHTWCCLVCAQYFS